MTDIYISVPRAAIHAVTEECPHGSGRMPGCHACYRRNSARLQLRAYLRATPPDATHTPTPRDYAEQAFHRAIPPPRFY